MLFLPIKAAPYSDTCTDYVPSSAPPSLMQCSSPLHTSSLPPSSFSSQLPQIAINHTRQDLKLLPLLPTTMLGIPFHSLMVGHQCLLPLVEGYQNLSVISLLILVSFPDTIELLLFWRWQVGRLLNPWTTHPAHFSPCYCRGLCPRRILLTTPSLEPPPHHPQQEEPKP